MTRTILIATGLLMLLSSSMIGGAAAQSAVESYGIYGAERFFSLTWAPGVRGGHPTVAGYISNDYGFTARDVRLRVESLDAAGNVVAKTTGYVAGVLTPGTHSYFEVPVATPAASYRVSVLSFEWLQKGKGIL